MSILRECIRAILKEASLTRDPETVGDLRALIDDAVSTKRSKQGKAAGKDLAKGILADLLPGGSTIAGAFDAFKAMYSMPDDKRTGTALDYLDVDDEVSAIVDDNVENKFLKAFAGLGSIFGVNGLSSIHVSLSSSLTLSLFSIHSFFSLLNI